MIKRRRFPKIYFGWWMNLAMGILSGSAGGFIQQGGASALFKPIASDLGLSRAVTSVATSIARLEGGIQAPITGWLSDKFGPKGVVFAGSCLTGVCLILMYFVNSVWAYYVVWGLIATGHNLGYTIAHDKVVTDWFINKRGLAFGVRFALLGIMGVIVLPIASWLIITQGWRMACSIWAIVIFAGIPFSWYFVKQNRPEYYGLLPDGAKMESGLEAGIGDMIAKGMEYAAGYQETEFTLRQAMRTSSYWMQTIAKCAYTIVFGGFNLHCIPFLTDMGIDPGVASCPVCGNPLVGEHIHLED